MSSIELVLTEQIITTWGSEGRNKLLALAKTHWKGTTEEKGSSSQFRSILYFLCQQAPNGKLKQDEVISFLQAFLKQKELLVDRDLFQSCLVDILCVLDVEVTCVKDSKMKKASFCRLVKELVERKLLSESLLKERLDFETLEPIGVVPNAKVFGQKYVRTKTQLFYKQQKFNLFREENEGYAKLAVELEFSTRVSQNPVLLLSHVQALIGQFSLDPNRVMDLILEAAEFYPQHFDFLVDFIQMYPSGPGTLSQLLIFKLSGTKSSSDPDPPHKLYKLLALLIKSGVLSLNEMYLSLLPADTHVFDTYQKVLVEAKKDSRATVTVQLENAPDKKELADLLIPDPAIIPPDYMLSNQKICLLFATLSIGDWENASLIFQKQPEHYPVLFPSIRETLVSLIEFSIEPIYRKYAPRLVRGRELEKHHNVFRYSTFKDLQSCNHMFEMCSEIGPYMALHPLLLIKLMRIGRAFLKEFYSLQQKEQGEFERCFQSFINLIDDVMFPSISLSGANCGLMEEMWNMMKLYPYEIRYSTYGAWKNSSYGATPIMMRAKAIVIENLRYNMKRLTKDNAKQIGRQLGKLVHSNSGVVFDYLLSQIQKFDNLIQPVVDAMKFLTNLSFDMLSYCIIEALSNPGRDRMKQEDTNISSWLQCLATFTGTLFRKCYSLGLTGLIQYVTNQLKSGKSFDLLVLKEVVQKMSGIDISEDTTDSQIEAMLGGELLRSEAGHFSQIRNIKRSSTRLRETLVEEHLGLPLCLLMAQHRNLLMFKDETEYHCKLLSHLYDQCQDTLVQFIDFMSCHLSPEEYTLHVPGLNELASKYHIGADAAFYLLRPSINHKIRTNLLKLQKEMEANSEKPKINFALAKNLYIESVDQSLSGILSDTKLLYPDKVWEDITVHLFVTFWSLAPYDVITPVEKYESEMARIKNLKQDVDNNHELNSSKKKKEQERLQIMIDKLQEELRQQAENHKLVLARIDHEKSTYFNTSVTRNRSITQFLQLCIFPRCCFTMTDALFCAQFVLRLHEQKTPHFSTLLFYDRVFSDISYTVTCCTENETRRYGKFLQAVLSTISRWHESRSTYERECSNTPGFVSMIRTSSDANERTLDFENFRHICFKWHFKITKSLVICLESKDYIQIRNALIILTKLLPQYPKVHHLSAALEKRVDKIKDDEKGSRDDLFIIASSYVGKLKNHKNNLLSEGEYHKKDERTNASESKRDGLSIREDKERSKASANTAQFNSKHSKSEDSQSHKARTQPSSNTNQGSKDSSAATNSARNNNHEGHGKDGVENGEEVVSDRDPKRRKLDPPNDKEKEINRIRERREEMEKERKGERKRERSRESEVSIESSKDVKRKRDEEQPSSGAEASSKEPQGGMRTPKLSIKRESLARKAHPPPSSNSAPKESKPALVQKKREAIDMHPKKHPAAPETVSPPAPIVTQAKKK